MAQSDPFIDETDEEQIPFSPPRRGFTRVKEKPCDLFGKTQKRKKPADLNPLQQRWFKANGWVFWRVEHPNPYGGVTVDMWGIGDYVAAKAGEGLVIVQVTTASNAAARVRKALTCPELVEWLAAGGRFCVHAWRQRGGPGTAWTMEIRELHPEPVGSAPGGAGEEQAE